MSERRDWEKETKRMRTGDVRSRPEPCQQPLRSLCDRDFTRKVNILNRVEQVNAFAHRALKCFTTGDETGAAATFVDDRRPHRFGQIAGALRLATGIDQTRAAPEIGRAHV